MTRILDAHRRKRSLGILVLVQVLWMGTDSVAAQQRSSTSGTIVGGVGLRGAGHVGDCCGPFRSDLGHQTFVWLAGSVSRELKSRFAIDVEVMWARELKYRAYVQGAFGDAPYRGYASENLVSTILPAGLLRWHALQRGVAIMDVVVGCGWVHERRVSDLRSVVFRPGPEPAPEYTFYITDVRNSVAPVAGVDLITGTERVSFVAQGRVHVVRRGDPDRSDLDLGRSAVRAGAGVRFRF